MDDGGKRLLARLLGPRRDDLIERATDWVIAASSDLGARRPRDETRGLVEKVVAGYEAALFAGDDGPMDTFIDFVTSFRADREFHISTLLKGFLSLRVAVEEALRAGDGDGRAAFEALSAVDAVGHRVMFRVADTYVDKLSATIQQRRRELEVELARVTEARTRELDEKIRTIEAQRRALVSLSSPVIRIWEGVLAAPLVGEIDAERAARVLERVLEEIVATASGVVLIDITGLTVLDARVAEHLVRLVHAARLLGAEGILVGMSAALARQLVDLELELGAIRSFATLHDGLRAALLGAGLQVTSAPLRRGSEPHST